MKRLGRELTTFVDTLTADFGRPERRTAMAQYITGLLLDGECKSIEPIAARLVRSRRVCILPVSAGAVASACGSICPSAGRAIGRGVAAPASPTRCRFAPKRQHALDLLDAALAAGVRRHVVLADAAFGEVTAFRDALTARGLSYVLRVPSTLVAWPPGTRFTVPARRGATGRPRSTPRPATAATPLTLATLATTLRHRRVTWREGSRGRQASRFAACRDARCVVSTSDAHRPRGPSRM